MSKKAVKKEVGCRLAVSMSLIPFDGNTVGPYNIRIIQGKKQSSEKFHQTIENALALLVLAKKRRDAAKKAWITRKALSAKA